MRTTASANGVFVKAYGGSTGVLVAFDVDPERRQGLLGFALQRQDKKNGPNPFLKASLVFPGMPQVKGQLVPTNVAPVQKFRWSDYTVSDGRTYRYTVHPVYGEAPDQLDVQDGPTVTVKTESFREGAHGVLFNRAAAASQAFGRKFPEVEEAINAAKAAGEPRPPLPPHVLAWLSRGLDEEILGFLERAEDDTWGVDIAIYEYELEAIVEAVRAARARGAKVRIVYHARANDEQTHANEANVGDFPEDAKRPRVTSKICHNKFVVLSRITGSGVRKPVATLCGSTNFTHNGVYLQANVLHLLRDASLSQRYLDLFEELFRGSDPSATKKFVNEKNPIAFDGPCFIGFSPRSGRADLNAFIAAVDAAQRDVLFCTAFDLYDPLLDALLGRPDDAILRFGLQNMKSRVTGWHRDRTARFAATALLSNGLEGFLKESFAGQKGSIHIHTKLLITDFTSDSPTVISGSHNLSISASEGNDENYLVLRDTDVADCYGVELMRLYDHYRFRFATKTETRPPALTPDDSWTERYFFQGSLSNADRLTFAGQS